MRSFRVEIVHNILKVLSGKFIQILFQVIKAFVVPKLLTPEYYGLWRSLSLIVQYGQHSQLGTHQTMKREMSYLSGKGEFELRHKVRNNCFYYNLFASLLIGSCLVIISFFTKGEFARFYRHGFRIFSFLVVAVNLFSFYHQLLRIEKQFTWFSILTTLVPIINVSLSIGLLLYLHDVLVLAYSLTIANFLALVLAINRLGWPSFQDIRMLEILRQIRVGFPLMLIPFMFMLVKSIDQIMIICFLEPQSLGYYGVALSVQEFFYLIPGVIGSTLAPYLFEEFGRTESALKCSPMFEKPTILISLVCAFVLVAFLCFVHLPIKYYLTRYLPALPVLYLLLFGVFTIGLIMVAGNFIVINRKEKSVLRWQVVGIILSVITNFAAIKLGYGIVGVAVATLITYFVYSTGILFIAYRLYLTNNTRVFKKIGKLYIPFLYLCFFLTLITLFVPNTAQIFVDDLKISCLRAAILLVASIPLLIFYDRKLGVVATAKRAMGW